MKFVKLLKYVERSFEGKPSFLILMDDGREYISNGCVFVENTEDNRKNLIEEFDCEKYLTELLDNGLELDISEITDSRCMFWGCTSLTSFNSDMSSVTDSYSMFQGCTSLTSFSADMSSVTDSRSMFEDCISLTSFSADMSGVTDSRWMFLGCTSLTSFNADMPKVTDSVCMLWGCTSLTDNSLEGETL